MNQNNQNKTRPNNKSSILKQISQQFPNSYKQIFTYRLWLPLVALAICLPAIWPFFDSRFFYMHDFTHVARLSEMHRALQDGHFPVRWSHNFGFGYGMPLFNFYGPLPYYLAVLFVFLGFSYVASIQAIFILNTLASFIGIYLLVNKYFGRFAGLLGATAFVYIPYRAVDMYVRGALNELTAITFIPFALYFLSQVIDRDKKRYVVASAISIAGILISHNLVTMMAFPVLILFALGILYFRKEGVDKSKIIKLIISFVLGISLSAFYVLPAIAEKDYTRVEDLTQGYSYYGMHFVSLHQFWNSEWGYGGSVLGPDDGMTLEVGKLQIILALLGTALVTIHLKKKDNIKPALIYMSGLVVLVSIFMASYRSALVWEALPLIDYLQFPWRFLSLIIVFICIPVGAVAYFIPKVIKPVITTALIILFVLYYKSIFVPDYYLEDTHELYYSQPERIATEMSSTLADFIPPQIDDAILMPAESRFKVITNGLAKVDIIDSRTHNLEVSVDTYSPIEFVANIFSFPGWQLFVNGTPIDHQISSPLPTIQTTVNLNDFASAQSRETEPVIIKLKWQETPIRQLANTITLLSVLLIIALPVHSRLIPK